MVTHVKDRTLWYGSLYIRTDNLSGFEAEDHPRNLGSPAGPGRLADFFLEEIDPVIGLWRKLIFLERIWAVNERRCHQMGQSVRKPTANTQRHRTHASVWGQLTGSKTHSVPCNLVTEEAEAEDSKINTSLSCIEKHCIEKPHRERRNNGKRKRSREEGRDGG